VSARGLLLPLGSLAAFVACGTTPSRHTTSPAPTSTGPAGTIAQIYYWRARPGDSVQLAALGPALDAAGMALEPDSVKRRLRGEYAATLRDRVGQSTARILR
jgi:hypothetical protein